MAQFAFRKSPTRFCILDQALKSNTIFCSLHFILIESLNTLNNFQNEDRQNKLAHIKFMDRRTQPDLCHTSISM